MGQSDIARQYRSIDVIHRNNANRNWAIIRTAILLSDFCHSIYKSVKQKAYQDLAICGRSDLIARSYPETTPVLQDGGIPWYA
ncbi:hypothetical protein SG73_24910 [Enterobacter hormaechei subsp. steigerwaltii]|uniref:Uncharacterized protein n=1 Tax=Enterobacter chengduensis TaxID=2494701 RepID=A0AAW3H9Z8_9ENTR|nr:hypothetical protein SS35_25580 [Enterobacter hormaechei subsp. steigerwaltii]KJX13438.1 hypothetical protein SG74_23485 [Enterobacter hormaechei subsp. xiangfangensis]KJX28320.1 hypothetical protein SG71_24980 [Enterobacter chengduensis]KJW76338.1 hypothetical protein SG70_25195 [Enterobacter hormaechei subsp. steigerwaltii]KJW76868.1 hypothetical protein SG68_24895 [Enterobacter hormaechei subsp. steigerwaltii]